MFDLLSNISSLFGGSGDVGTTPIEQGVGYSPEVPMSTGVQTGMNVPFTPTDASGGQSPGLWQQILSFLGPSGTSPSAGGGGTANPKNPSDPSKQKSDLADFGKFLTAAQGLQSTLQNSKVAQQMIQQHVYNNSIQRQYQAPADVATRILQNAGLV